MNRSSISTSKASDKLERQEKQYSFPYHYLPRRDDRWGVRRARVLGWGYEYLCYQECVLAKVRALRPRSVLEVGCGDGRFIGALGDDVPRRVGADLSTRALSFARAFNPDVYFHDGDAADLPGDFDVVVAIEVLEHVPDEDVSAFLRTLFDQTRTGGVVVICVPSVVLRLTEKHFRHYTVDLLTEQLLQARVEHRVVSAEHICRVPAWLPLYDRLTINRHWVFDCALMSQFIWSRVHRQADRGNGRHIVMILENRGLVAARPD